MLVENCDYNLERDIQVVDQFGFVDLVAANRNNSIDNINTISEGHFNMIADPKSISFRPSDIFDVMQAAKAITEYKSDESSDTDKSE